MMFDLVKFQSYNLIIFDRDGVLNHKPNSPNSYILNPSELVLNEEILNVICELQKMHKKIAVATNQQCVGKGLVPVEVLNSIHRKINQSIVKYGGSFIDFYSCTHLESENCECRKPKAKLLIDAIKKYQVARSETIFVGDSVTDELAALNAGIKFYAYQIH